MKELRERPKPRDYPAGSIHGYTVDLSKYCDELEALVTSQGEKIEVIEKDAVRALRHRKRYQKLAGDYLSELKERDEKIAGLERENSSLIDSHDLMVDEFIE